MARTRVQPNDAGDVTVAGQSLVRVSTGGVERVRVNSAGNVGIGTSSPVDRLHVAGGIRSARFTTDAAANALNFRKSRGTEASPTIVANADTLGQIQFWGYDGASDQYAAAILAGVDGTPGAGDMPSRLVFFTTPDGGTSITERMRINNAGLITGSGTSLGAWTAYTPTWTNLTVGSATQEHYYVQVGKIVHVHGAITFAADTSVSGDVTLTLPVTARNVNNSRPFGVAQLFDSSAGAAFLGYCNQGSGTTTVSLRVINSNGTYAAREALSASIPFTWAVSDTIRYSYTYEAA